MGIPYAIIRELCESAGIRPEIVEYIHITPFEVTFECIEFLNNGGTMTANQAVRICTCNACKDVA